jgi:hypothetical protein
VNVTAVIAESTTRSSPARKPNRHSGAPTAAPASRCASNVTSDRAGCELCALMTTGQPHHGMTPDISGSSLSAQARYAAGTREILEGYFAGTKIRDEYLIVEGGKLAGTGAPSYSTRRQSPPSNAAGWSTTQSIGTSHCA